MPVFPVNAEFSQIKETEQGEDVNLICRGMILELEI